MTATSAKFTFEAYCPGYSRRGASDVYTADMIDAHRPEIRTRDLVVRR